LSLVPLEAKLLCDEENSYGKTDTVVRAGRQAGRQAGTHNTRGLANSHRQTFNIEEISDTGNLVV